MKSSLTRRSFVKSASAGLAGISLLAAGARSLYAAPRTRPTRWPSMAARLSAPSPSPDTWPIIDEREEKALLKALKSRNWCCLRGNAVYDFEKMFAEAMGVPHCVLTNGGTTALSASLHVLGVGPGDEVITTPAHVHRHDQHDHQPPRPACLRGYRPGHRLDQRRPDRGSHHGAHEGDPARPSGGLAGGYREDHGHLQEAQYPRDRGCLPVGLRRGQRQEGRHVRQDRLHQFPGMEVARLRRGRRDPRQRRRVHASLCGVRQQRPRPEETGERLSLPRLEPPHDRVPGRGPDGAVQTIPGAGPLAPRERPLRRSRPWRRSPA